MEISRAGRRVLVQARTAAIYIFPIGSKAAKIGLYIEAVQIIQQLCRPFYDFSQWLFHLEGHAQEDYNVFKLCLKQRWQRR